MAGGNSQRPTVQKLPLDQTHSKLPSVKELYWLNVSLQIS